MHPYIAQLENQQKKENLTPFHVGDTVRVDYKVTEGKRERIQAFEGTVIKIQGVGARKTFTVRKVSYGIGVERTFPLHAPRVEGVKVLRHGRVRRSKLYYLRERQGKAAKVKEMQR